MNPSHLLIILPHMAAQFLFDINYESAINQYLDLKIVLWGAPQDIIFVCAQNIIRGFVANNFKFALSKYMNELWSAVGIQIIIITDKSFFDDFINRPLPEHKAYCLYVNEGALYIEHVIKVKRVYKLLQKIADVAITSRCCIHNGSLVINI